MSNSIIYKIRTRAAGWTIICYFSIFQKQQQQQQQQLQNQIKFRAIINISIFRFNYIIFSNFQKCY